MEQGATGGVLDNRVLVVDDDVNFHRLVETTLGQVGVGCVCVRSGEEAQRLLTGSIPRAVILDGLLPGVRGDELARRIRKRYPQEILPIVFISAFYRDMKSYRTLTGECGVDVVLHKPITPEQLRAALAPLLVSSEPEPEPAKAEEEPAPSDGQEEIELVLEEGEERATPEMIQLRAEYLANSKERAYELEAALGTLSGPGAEDALHMLRVEAHRFRGSGASFGFEAISRLAGAVEDLILENPGLASSPQLRARLTGLVEALVDKVLVAAGASPISVERRVTGLTRRVLLVDREESRLVERAREAAAREQPIDAATDLDAALRSAIEQRPDVIFLVADDGAAVVEAMQRLRAGTKAPVVVLARSDRLEDWLESLRAGAVGYVARPPDVESLFRLASVYARPRITANVVAVGGDRASLSGLAELLAPRGLAVEPCASAEEFFASLERAAPSLVILDGDLPEVGAIDLVRVLRADLNFRRVPVMVCAGAEADQAERIATYEAGASDWVGRPVAPDELVARILALLARECVGMSHRRGRDPVTGLFDRGYLLEACTRAVQLGRREGRAVALLGIDLRLESLRREAGRLAADEVLMAMATRLSSVFRTSDVIARVGPSRLVAMLHGAARPDAERLLEIELGQLAEQRFVGGWQPKARGAVAVFPEITGGAEALLEAVEEELGS